MHREKIADNSSGMDELILNILCKCSFCLFFPFLRRNYTHFAFTPYDFSHNKRDQDECIYVQSVKKHM